MKKYKRSVLKKILKGGITLLGLIIALSGAVYAAGETTTWLNTANSVKFISYYQGNDAYIITEDTYNRGTPIDSLINGLNAGYVIGPNIAKSYGGNWPLTLTNGDAYTIWMVDDTAGTAGSAEGTYNSASDNTTTLGSTPGTRLTLSGTYYLSTPSFVGYAGNGSVMLTWEAVTGSDVSYLVYRRAASTPKGTNNWIAYGKVTEKSGVYQYADASVSNGNNYYYLIIAKDGAAKISAHSDEIQLYPNASVPPFVTSISPGSGNNGSTTAITIKGAGFTGTSIVSLESVFPTTETVATGTNLEDSDNQISASVPAGIDVGIYNIIVTTANGTSEKTYLGTFEVVASANPPNTPQNFRVTSKTANDITWAWDDVSGEDQFGLFDGTDTEIATMAANVTSTIEGSAPNTQHVRKAASHNDYGYSGYTSVIDTYTYAMAPFNLTAEVNGSTSIEVFWEAAGIGNDPSRYEVQRAPDSGGSPGTWATLESNVTSKSYLDETCNPNTTYYYKVKGFNGSDDPTVFTNITSEATLPGAPTAPTGFSGTALATNEVRWSWDDVGDESNYVVCSGASGVNPVSGMLPQDTIQWDETTGLTANTEYIRHVNAVNVSGTTEGSSDSVFTLAEPPTNLTAEALSTKRISLSWIGLAPKYRVERSSDNFASPPEYSFDVTGSTATHDATVAGGGTLKYYRVKSYNDEGVLNQTAGNVTDETTLSDLPAPTNATGEVLGINSIKWSCTDEATDEAGYRLLDGSYSTIWDSPGDVPYQTSVITVEGGLTPCKQYTRYWRVYRQYDDSTDSAAMLRSTLPVKPGQPTENSKDQTSITINLDPGSNETAGLTYIVEISSEGTGWVSLPEEPGTSTTYYKGGLTPQTYYLFRTAAKNTEGVTSEYSEASPPIDTLGAGQDTLPPVIDRIKMNNRNFVAGDILAPITNTIGIITTDMPTVGSSGIASVEVTLDEGYPYEQTFVLTGPFSPGSPYAMPPTELWQGTFSFSQDPEYRTVASHNIKITVKDANSNLTTREVSGVTMKGTTQIIGQLLNYPNPFKPLSGERTNIQYTLSNDAPVLLVIYDITGQEVFRNRAAAGQTGGRAGVNTVEWNGKLFGSDQFGAVGNGMYVYKIVVRGKVVGTGKLVILDE
ncbi:T9SS type A sorting domain-containing protein [Candidatus Margulisiibacteriota bacterium]